MTFYNEQNPIIENGKLVLISNGGSPEPIGIRAARAQLTELENKGGLRESTIARRDVLRKGVALWEVQH